MDINGIEARVVRREPLSKYKIIGLQHARLRGEDFSNRKLDWFNAHDCRFEECRFDGLRIARSASFGEGREQSLYIDCSFDGARIRYIDGGNSRFVRCSFRNVDLRDWFCFETELVECTFSGRLRNAIFNGAVHEKDRPWVGRDRNEFRGNDFSNMELMGVSFRTGIDLAQQRLPSGPQYLYLPDAATAVQRAREEVIGWNDFELRREAMVLIRTLEFELQGGQRQLFLRTDSPSPLRREAEEPVFGILRRFAAPPPGS